MVQSAASFALSTHHASDLLAQEVSQDTAGVRPDEGRSVRRKRRRRTNETNEAFRQNDRPTTWENVLLVWFLVTYHIRHASPPSCGCLPCPVLHPCPLPQQMLRTVSCKTRKRGRCGLPPPMTHGPRTCSAAEASGAAPALVSLNRDGRARLVRARAALITRTSRMREKRCPPTADDADELQCSAVCTVMFCPHIRMYACRLV